jgi:hypothetical protein
MNAVNKHIIVLLMLASSCATSAIWDISYGGHHTWLPTSYFIASLLILAHGIINLKKDKP